MKYVGYGNFERKEKKMYILIDYKQSKSNYHTNRLCCEVDGQVRKRASERVIEFTHKIGTEKQRSGESTAHTQAIEMKFKRSSEEN